MTGMELALLWAKALKADAALNDLCTERYGKPPLVIVGYDSVREFGKGEAPYVCLHPVDFEGGPEAERREYGVAVFLGVSLKQKDVDADGVLVNAAMLSMDNEFCPAVLKALEGLDAPPLAGESVLWPAENGYCEKHLTLSYSEDQPFNVNNPWK